MREMKNSGIEWVHNIPHTWELHPLYYYFSEHKHKNSLGLENNLLSLSYGRIIRKDINTSEGLLPESFNGYNIIDKNDIVLRLTDLQNDKRSLRTGLARERGIITSAYITLRAKRTISSRYFHYLLHAYDISKVLYNMGNGVRLGLNYSELSKLMLIEPSMDEQETISNYLDTKCAEIDALTADIQTQIDTLEQYKRSVITEAVTKGLNPNAEMKDSGIEWVGTIPSHWVIHPLYAYFGERKRKNKFGSETNLLSLSYGKVIRKDINTSEGLLPESFNTYNIVEPNDIVIRPTDLQNDKRSFRTGLVKEHGIITSAYIDLCPLKTLDSRYFHYLLHTYDVMKVFYNMGNGVRQGLNYSEFSHLMVFEPTHVEQTQITDYLDTKVSDIDSIIDQKKEQLETLESYKKSLIYEYVTGKKEVPVAESDVISVILDPHIAMLGLAIDKLGKDIKGKTQLQKILYLLDEHLGFNHSTQYYRYAHGPYDLQLNSYIDTLTNNRWYKHQYHGADILVKGSNHNNFIAEHGNVFAEKNTEVDNLIKFLKPMKTSQVERIATLFATWNDFIIDGISHPTDDQIINEVMTNWTDNKANTQYTTWQSTLAKMKQNGIIPKGKGLHTLPMPQKENTDE